MGAVSVAGGRAWKGAAGAGAAGRGRPWPVQQRRAPCSGRLRGHDTLV